jgi:hypothetical protein
MRAGEGFAAGERKSQRRTLQLRDTCEDRDSFLQGTVSTPRLGSPDGAGVDGAHGTEPA